MEYKLLEAQDVMLMLDFVDDGHTKYDPQHIYSFLNEKNSYGFVVKDTNKIIGFAYGYALIKPNGQTYFYVHSVDIAVAYKNQGFGTELMRYIRNYSKSIGCEKLFLITNKRNIGACKCYEKAGGVCKSSNNIVYEYKD